VQDNADTIPAHDAPTVCCAPALEKRLSSEPSTAAPAAKLLPVQLMVTLVPETTAFGVEPAGIT